MFLVTGDLHGDAKDLQKRRFGRIGADDFIVICGDFGLVWDGSKEEQKELERLGRSRHGVLFLDGAHENFDLLARYPVTDWNGGKAQIISGNLVHLMRGQVYTIAGKRVFTFGGGESEDREMRTPHQSWWPQEMPDEQEMRAGVQALVEAQWQVDYIFTYEAPTAFHKYIESGSDELNALNVYLECIREKCRYQKWVFGCYHKDRSITPDFDAVFGGVVRLQ